MIYHICIKEVGYNWEGIGLKNILCDSKIFNCIYSFLPNIIFRFVKLNSKYRLSESSTAQIDWVGWVISST